MHSKCRKLLLFISSTGSRRSLDHTSANLASMTMSHLSIIVAISSWISFRATNVEPLSTLLLSRLRRAFTHNPIRLLIRPKLKVIRAIPRLADLPRHPRNPQIVEHSNVVLESLRFALARSTELLEQHELVGVQRMLQCDGTFRPELLDAAVRVYVDDIESFASPILRDVGVREFVAAACFGSSQSAAVVDIARVTARLHSPVEINTPLLPMISLILSARSHHQPGTGATFPFRCPCPSF
jgi:hypothetical protein